jgi:hypothetical protein
MISAMSGEKNASNGVSTGVNRLLVRSGRQQMRLQVNVGVPISWESSLIAGKG